MRARTAIRPLAWLVAVAALCIVLRAPLPARTTAAAVQTPALPDRLSDAEFRQLVTDTSETGGSFHGDNFTSNESDYTAVMDELIASGRRGGAYLGVGPEQNFNYILALRPAVSFVVDIRRQAVIQHLMFKALFDLSTDRVDFISRLFSFPRPAGLPADATIKTIWEAFPASAGTDKARYLANQTAIEDNLTKTHGFTLSADDRTSLEYVCHSFFDLGPTIDYGGYNRASTTGGTNFAKLTSATDTAGVARSFLGTEENFRAIKDLQARNLIVPVQGDFAGPHALRAVGEYLKAHGATVTAFYVSNVEQYLFGLTQAGDANGGFRKFYDNVSTLPTTASSVFVRLGFGSTTIRTTTPDGRPVTNRIIPVSLCPIQEFLTVVAAGKIQNYGDARACGR